MKFFFEEGSEEKEEQVKDTGEKEFFFALQKAGVIQEPGEKPEEISSAAEMKSYVGKLVTIEYGVYQNTYAVHITPTHASRNLSDDQKVYDAMYQLCTIMNKYVPPTLSVKLYPPRSDWQMKVISAVIDDGASAWNFDTAKFEGEAIPQIKEAIEKIAMR